MSSIVEGTTSSAIEPFWNEKSPSPDARRKSGSRQQPSPTRPFCSEQTPASTAATSSANNPPARASLPALGAAGADGETHWLEQQQLRDSRFLSEDNACAHRLSEDNGVPHRRASRGSSRGSSGPAPGSRRDSAVSTHSARPDGGKRRSRGSASARPDSDAAVAAIVGAFAQQQVGGSSGSTAAPRQQPQGLVSAEQLLASAMMHTHAAASPFVPQQQQEQQQAAQLAQALQQQIAQHQSGVQQQSSDQQIVADLIANMSAQQDPGNAANSAIDDAIAQALGAAHPQGGALLGSGADLAVGGGATAGGDAAGAAGLQTADGHQTTPAHNQALTDIKEIDPVATMQQWDPMNYTGCDEKGNYIQQAYQFDGFTAYDGYGNEAAFDQNGNLPGLPVWDPWNPHHPTFCKMMGVVDTSRVVH